LIKEMGAVAQATAAEGQALAPYNVRIAQGHIELQYGRFRRAYETAQLTEATTTAPFGQVNRMEQAWQQWDAAKMNAANMPGQAGARFSSNLGTLSQPFGWAANKFIENVPDAGTILGELLTLGVFVALAGTGWGIAGYAALKAWQAIAPKPNDPKTLQALLGEVAGPILNQNKAAGAWKNVRMGKWP
jgi:hypothetical protein